MTHRVRTTMHPDQEIEVGDAELLDLQRMGLLADAPKPAPQTAATTAPKKPTTGNPSSNQ